MAVRKLEVQIAADEEDLSKSLDKSADKVNDWAKKVENRGKAKLDVDDDPAKRGVNRAEGHLKGVTDKKWTAKLDVDEDGFLSKIKGVLGKGGSLLKGVGMVAGGAVLGAGAGLALAAPIFNDVTNKASDLNETISKVGVIFGKEAAPEIEKFASTAATQLGQSKQQAMDAAATFAVFGKSAGLSGKSLSTFSTDFTTLASDLASFHNASPQETIEAIGAALRGEAEPMRRFGVLLDDASMRQKALELGIISTTKEALTPQQKVLAAQALIFEQTKDAQGDFLRTSDGLANKTRIANAQLENMKTTIGEKLLPVKLRLVSILSEKILPLFEKWGPIIADKVGPALDKVIDGVSRFAEAFKAQNDLGEWHAVGMFEKLGVIAAQVFGWLRDNVPPIISAVSNAFTNYIIPAVQATASWVQNTLIPAITDLVNWFQTKLTPIIADVRDWFDTRLKPALEDFGVMVDTKLVPALSNFWQFVQSYVLPVIKKLADWYMDYVYPAFVSFIENIVEVAVRLLTLEGAVASFVLNAISKIDDFVRGVKNKFGEAIDWIRGLPGRISDAVGDLGSLLWDKGRQIVQGLIDGLTSKLGPLRDIADKIGGVVSGAVSLINKISSPSKVMYELGQYVVQGYIDGLGDGQGDISKVSSAMAMAPAAAVGSMTPQGRGGGGTGFSLTVINRGVVSSERQIADMIIDAARQGMLVPIGLRV
jgi:hypothetical protein